MSRSRSAGRARLHELRVETPAGLADAVGELLLLAGAGGVLHEDHGEKVVAVVVGERRSALAALSRAVGRALRSAGLALPTEIRPSRAAAGDFRRGPELGPVRVSPTLSLVPAGAGVSPAADRVVLHRALAFGFGDHATTRMAAREVERICRAHPASSVLDVGTGTGVLAIVAALRGARGVVGVDTDPDAVRVARRNARTNRVADRVRIRPGSAPGTRQRFDLVVANLELRALLSLVPVWRRLVRPAGTLVVTGFLTGHSPDVVGALGHEGFAKIWGRREGGYSLLVFEREAARSSGFASRGRPRRRATGRGRARTTRSR